MVFNSHRLKFVLAMTLACAGTSQAQQQPQRGQRQSQPTTQQAQPTSPQAQQTQSPAEQPANPQRTEILTFDNWSVTCSEFESPKRTSCSATLRVIPEQTKQVVFAWTIANAGDKKLTSAVVTPTGVRIDQGVSLKLGKANARKISFATCDPQRCTGTLAIDEALVKEASQAETAEAEIQLVDGRSVRFTFPLKGIDRAVAQLRK